MSWRTSSSWVVLALLVIVSAGESQVHTRRPLRPALLLSVGAGGFPRPRNIETGTTDEGRLVLGAAIDVPLGERLLFEPVLGYGLVPMACLGGCPPSGTTLELGVLWIAASSGKWGLLLGPSLGRTDFDGARAGVGGTASLGAVRGVGPRFTVRYHTLSGAGHPSSLMGLFAIRLGK